MRWMFLATKDDEVYRIINLENIVDIMPVPDNPNQVWLVTTAGTRIDINESFEQFKLMLEKYITATFAFDNKVLMERQRQVQGGYLKELLDVMQKG